ncbi:MAG: hypothetical protein N2508_02100 [Anaerolineae bacterium]|nr:hypothetical protein [Anaerolineae bacterium]
MENTWLRWKGRIGSLKRVAVLGIMGAFVGLAWSTNELSTARLNPSAPQAVTLAQIVDGEVGRPRYVAVEGYAMYEFGYKETIYGIKIAEYYYLFDVDEGYAVLIKADHMNLNRRVDGPISLTGITAFPTSPDLYMAIANDVERFADMGFRITPDIYIRESARPSGALTADILVAVFVAAGLVSLVILAFPSVVFVAAPAQPGGVTQQGGVRQGVQVTGRLQRLKRVQPTIEVGRGWRKFTKAVANIIPLEDRQVMVYVHCVYWYGGIKVSDTHWGLTLDSMNVVFVEPGKVLGFKDRWAVRFVHRQRQGKPEELIVSFARPEDQAYFVALLRRAHFAIGGTGIA